MTTLVLVASLSAYAVTTEAVGLATTLADAEVPSSVPLLLQGYNYTDHYIDSYSVNGQGGGNLFESSLTSGGGGSVCCVLWQRSSVLPITINVRWVAGYCMRRERNPYPFGDPYHEIRVSLWREQDALITEAAAENPRTLEIHFYRDGHIEAAVTQGESPPRLKLPREANLDRPGVNQEIARCPDGAK